MLAIDDSFLRSAAQSTVSIKTYPEKDLKLQHNARPIAGYLLGCLAPFFKRKFLHGDDLLEKVAHFGRDVEKLPKSEIIRRLLALRKPLRRESSGLVLTAEVFALTRELCARSLGKRPYDVQIYAAWVMLNGMVAEMETGEGKTLAVSLAAAITALSGVPVHVLTVNDYLAERDATTLLPLYSALGLSVGIVKANMGPDERRAAYACDLTYCTAKELAFDYLRDRTVFDRNTGDITRHIDKLCGRHSRSTKLLLRGLHFAIVDECDSILIDEADTPLVLAGTAKGGQNRETYQSALKIAHQLKAGLHFNADSRDRSIELTSAGVKLIRQLLSRQESSRTGLTEKLSVITTALKAVYLYQRDRDYIVRDNKVQVVDENTGRIRVDYAWERGLQQMIEAKECCEFSAGRKTLSRISFQRLFRRYLKFSGTTGTAAEVKWELYRVYGLGTIRIPTHAPVRRSYLPEQVFTRHDAKLAAVVDRVQEVRQTGRPVLLATRSVEASEILSDSLNKAGLRHQLLSAKQDKHEAHIIAQAGSRGNITIATNMAGRGTDITLQKDVLELGGLHVIATERHEARRIDRQLFGRCARQGDPGSCELFTSLEDDLMTMYCPVRVLALLKGPLLRHGGLIKLSIRLAGRIAQRRAEGHHYQMRRDLLLADKNMAESLGFSGPCE